MNLNGCKEALTAYFDVLSQHLLTGNEENHKNMS
jgi:hypothetical protein